MVLAGLLFMIPNMTSRSNTAWQNCNAKRIIHFTLSHPLRIWACKFARVRPCSPLGDISDVSCSSPQILKGIYSMNFKKPSKIQERSLPLMLTDPPTNMIAQSQSGTGKTAAFVITILSRLDYSRPTQPQALCLAPSRELARQIEGVVRSIGQFVDGLTIQAAVPGALERGKRVEAMVVVGTPGTVMDMIKRRQFDPSGMKILCLDEADNMLDQQGLGDQCMRVKA